MANFNAKITTNALLNVKVSNLGGSLSSPGPITLKNQISEINSIEHISDVDEINVTNGATLIYNSTTDKYEIKLLEFSNIVGENNLQLDGGTF